MIEFKSFRAKALLACLASAVTMVILALQLVAPASGRNQRLQAQVHRANDQHAADTSRTVAVADAEVLYAYGSINGGWCDGIEIQQAGRAGKSAKCRVCRFGALPGDWFSKAQPGNRWTLLHSSGACQLQPLLGIPASSSPLANTMAHPVQGKPITGGASTLSHASQGRPSISLSVTGSGRVGDAPQQPRTYPARVMFLGDSVDKHLMRFWCEHAGGVVEQVPPTQHPLDPHNPANASSYLVHVCRGAAGVPGLRLAAAYFPGVHPTGPYHRRVVMDYRQRVHAAQAAWTRISPSAPPHLLVLSSCLWDIARMAGHEPQLLTSDEIPLHVLRAWQANFTRVVQYAASAFPAAGLVAYHTTLPPRHDPTTGVMERPYLGRRHHVMQLNAAGVAAAHTLQLEVVDYVAVGWRFADGQSYLMDLIHPGPTVALELANVYANYAAQLDALTQASSSGSVRSSSVAIGERAVSWTELKRGSRVDNSTKSGGSWRRDGGSGLPAKVPAAPGSSTHGAGAGVGAWSMLSGLLQGRGSGSRPLQQPQSRGSRSSIRSRIGEVQGTADTSSSSSSSGIRQTAAGQLRRRRRREGMARAAAGQQQQQGPGRPQAALAAAASAAAGSSGSGSIVGHGSGSSGAVVVVVGGGGGRAPGGSGQGMSGRVGGMASGTQPHISRRQRLRQQRAEAAVPASHALGSSSSSSSSSSNQRLHGAAGPHSAAGRGVQQVQVHEEGG